MKKDALNKFKKMFEAQKNSLLFNDKILREDFSVSIDDQYDEIDQATVDADQAMRMRLRNRETLYLKKIQEALARIDEGHFGLCEECGEEIELKRLEARPTASLCVSCKEDEERKEGSNADGRIHKSLGEPVARRFFNPS